MKATAFLVALIALVPAQASALDKLITVTGEATKSAAPDTVTIRLGVMSQGKTAREASEANAKKMTTVIVAIKDAGANEADIQTARLSLQPQFEQNKNGPAKLVGFHASNDVTVKLHDVGKLAELVDHAVSAGANEISGIDFSVANRSKLLDDARGEAVADARRKAEIYAKAAGVVVGRPMSISESTALPHPPQPMAYRAVATPIAPGEVAMQVTVTVSYELTQ
jgi:uncharacterized protein YggE